MVRRRGVILKGVDYSQYQVIVWVMDKNILLVVHQENSDPGRIAHLLMEMGYNTDLRRLACGDPLPETMDHHQGVVVFGGPMSANDETIPFVRAELDWIPKALMSGKPYLGVCLGAQLLARVMGAKVAPHADGITEIGYCQIDPTAAGQHLFDENFYVYQWHQEGFDLPRGAIHLASGGVFPNQAFCMDTSAPVYGIQFHPEVTEKIMQRWTTRAAHRLLTPGAQPAKAHFDGHAKYDRAVDGWLRRFMHHWLGQTLCAK